LEKFPYLVAALPPKIRFFVYFFFPPFGGRLLQLRRRSRIERVPFVHDVAERRESDGMKKGRGYREHRDVTFVNFDSMRIIASLRLQSETKPIRTECFQNQLFLLFTLFGFPAKGKFPPCPSAVPARHFHFPLCHQSRPYIASNQTFVPLCMIAVFLGLHYLNIEAQGAAVRQQNFMHSSTGSDCSRPGCSRMHQNALRLNPMTICISVWDAYDGILRILVADGVALRFIHQQKQKITLLIPCGFQLL